MRELERDVVQDMSGPDVVVEVVDQCGVVAVDAARRTAHVREMPVREVGDVHVGVVQPCVEHQPEVHHHVRPPVPEKGRPHPVLNVGVDGGSNGCQHTDGRRDDVRPLPLLEDLRRREEVRLGPIAVETLSVGGATPSCGVANEVQGPPEDEVDEGVHHNKGILPHHLPDVVVKGRSVPVVGNVGLPVKEVVGEVVVLVVRETPRVERDKKCGVHDKPHDVVDPRELAPPGKGSVSALVPDDPQPREHGPHHHRVHRPHPQPRQQRRVGHHLKLHEGVEGIEAPRSQRSVVEEPEEGNREGYPPLEPALQHLTFDFGHVREGLFNSIDVPHGVDDERPLPVGILRTSELDHTPRGANPRGEHVVLRLEDVGKLVGHLGASGRSLPPTFTGTRSLVKATPCRPQFAASSLGVPDAPAMRAALMAFTVFFRNSSSDDEAAMVTAERSPCRSPLAAAHSLAPHRTPCAPRACEPCMM
eukprot:Sspe_Gene.31106::Locus_15357_Transcript_1_1_Confidence_1.000_Length_2184::g.31106::m.31106